MRTYHLDDTERMIQNVLGNRREITVHGSSAFPCASYLDYYKKSAYPWHWHDEMEIAYIQEGEAEATIDGRKYRLLEGDGYFANCRVLHAVAGVGEEEMRMPNILFHPSLCMEPVTAFSGKIYGAAGNVPGSFPCDSAGRGFRGRRIYWN